ncbi:RagB/SusD family nutrient uptake outer membrane protein [Niabella ginsengisoli]|uniref:RagB/SusD family nutrient uptake outer membrane protein n=1 Tax=Niabella ginsengisoli TaxID=522298 RepID=A0ABS9SL90_9BACT|nr:RagB/SusD family nutrient uptake outer membrane protein [Niabella ginsengisoli]MCH5599130.1 RagB/SusD family nutrient uptake outer membrane protein [Niabella ginsengisoli]
MRLKKHMKQLTTWLLAAILVGPISSCKKYLDIVPDNVGTLDYAFRNKNEAENYLFACYSTMQRQYNVIVNPGFTLAAEVLYPTDPNGFGALNEACFSLIKGLQTPSNPLINYWDGEGGAEPMYQAIRRCNIMLENIDNPIDLDAQTKSRWLGETKFLKAYYHYTLLKMYGPIPLIKENLPISASAEEAKIKRATLDESFEYVLGLLDEAIPDLPPTIQNRAQELGRITKVIAMSLKAEILATQASPLFNGNPDYINTKDKDGRNLFPQSYDAAKWQKAADACLAAIEEAELVGIKLHDTFIPTGGINNLSDEQKQTLMLQTVVTEKWENNLEIIWGYNYGFNYQNYVIPRMTDKSVASANSNPASFSVPIATTNLFYSKNGVPINEDVDFDYVNRYRPQAGDDANKSYIKLGYETATLNLNREPRFYASLGFDGGIWLGNGINDATTARHVQGRGPTALAGPKSIGSTNITGYWPKKLANYLTVYDETFQTENYRMAAIRLASLYLLYAEVLNESNGPSATVYEYIDKVRERAGLAGVVESWQEHSRNPGKPQTKEGLRQIIHQERRIELCFEAQSGWDLRRWKELQDVLSQPLQGWNVNEEASVNYYQPKTVLIPVFGQKNYLWPIETEALIVNNNLTQNPYW